VPVANPKRYLLQLPAGPARGDLSHFYPFPTVSALQGALVPPVTGADLSKVLTVTSTVGSGSLAYLTPGASAGASVKETYACPATVSVLDAVYFSAPGTVDKADATTSLTICVGVVIAKPTAVTAEVMHYGVTAGWVGLTTNATYYLSLVAGVLTLTAPTGTGEVRQAVGVASSATTLVVMTTREYILL